MAYKPYIEGSLSGGSIYKRRFVVDTAETFVAGALVYYDVSGTEYNLKVLGSNGVLCLGMALESAAEGIASNDGKCLVAVFTKDTVLRMKCSSTPTVANLLIYSYGVTMSSGVPTLDLTETTYDLFNIIDIDDDTGEAICIPVTALPQIYSDV